MLDDFDAVNRPKHYADPFCKKKEHLTFNQGVLDKEDVAADL